MVESVWLHGRRWFTAGLLVGAVTVGLIVSPVSVAVGLAVPASIRVGLAGVVALGLAAMQATGRGRDLPQNRRLVPQTVMARGPVHGPLQFGFEMGLGSRTYITTALPLAALALVILAGGGMAAPLLAAVGFGAGRVALVPLRGRAPEPWDRRLRATRTRFLAIVTVAFVAVAAIVLRGAIA